MLSALNFWQVTEIPGLEKPNSVVPPPPSIAPLVGAFSEGETVAVAWFRPRAQGPIEILVGGDRGIGSRAQPLGA